MTEGSDKATSAGDAVAMIQLALDERRYRDALAMAERCVAEGEQVPLLLRARSLWGSGAYDEALSAFSEASDGALQADAIVACAQALASLSRVDEAIDRLVAASAHWPGSVEIAFLAALFRLDSMAPAEALPQFEAIFSRSPRWGELQLAVMGLELVTGKRRPETLDFGRPRANARWRFMLHQAANIPPARLMGTAAGVMSMGLQAAADSGLTLEFGVFQGRSIRQIAAGTDGIVHGFDSFQGLPEAWTPSDQMGHYSTNGVMPWVPSNVVLHPGLFDDTLQAFMSKQREPVRLAHVDCDLFSSTVTVLESIASHLVAGSVLVFDDYMGIPGGMQHEFEAFEQVSRRHGWKHEYLAFSFMGREAAVRLL